MLQQSRLATNKWIYLIAVSGVAVVTAKASSNLNNEKEKENDGVSSPQDGNLLRSAPAASAGAASENGENMHFSRVSAKKPAVKCHFLWDNDYRTLCEQQ